MVNKGELWFYKFKNGIPDLDSIHVLKGSDTGREVCKIIELARDQAGVTHWEWRYSGRIGRIEQIPESFNIN